MVFFVFRAYLGAGAEGGGGVRVTRTAPAVNRHFTHFVDDFAVAARVESRGQRVGLLNNVTTVEAQPI